MGYFSQAFTAIDQLVLRQVDSVLAGMGFGPCSGVAVWVVVGLGVLPRRFRSSALRACGAGRPATE